MGMSPEEIKLQKIAEAVSQPVVVEGNVETPVVVAEAADVVAEEKAAE